MNKKIFFLIGLPRSGNTLLASLINQNPKMACTANSLVFGILYELYKLKNNLSFLNFPDHKSLDNVSDSIIDTYYKDWTQEYIIDRSPALTPINYEILKQHFKQPIKCIILWRDFMDVIASYIKWFKTEPSSYLNKINKNTIEEKLLHLLDEEEMIPRQLLAVQNALKIKNEIKLHIVRYNDLVLNTKDTLNSIYDFLEIEHYNHYYNNLKQLSINGIEYNDGVVGNNLHTIKTEIKLEENPYKKMIPQSIIDKYGYIKL
jgi:sulfotransferase